MRSVCLSAVTAAISTAIVYFVSKKIIDMLIKIEKQVVQQTTEAIGRGCLLIWVSTMNMAMCGILDSVNFIKIRILSNFALNSLFCVFVLWFLGSAVGLGAAGMLYGVIFCNLLVLVAYSIKIWLVNWHEQSSMRVQHLNHELMMKRMQSEDKQSSLLNY